MRRENPATVSVIIPCKGHASELEGCLAGLSRMKVQAPYEIIVVDSASDPYVLAVVQAFPNVRFVRSEQDLHAGPARNLGVEHALGNYLAFIDADCVPTVHWLQAAYDALHDRAQIVGGPVLDALSRHPVAVVDNLLQFADLPAGRPAGVAELLPGCNLAVRREAFEVVGGFPANPVIEDTLFTNAVAQSWPDACRFVPEMQVAHRGRRNLKDLWRHQARFGYVRGLHRFRITESQQKLGAYWVALPLSMGKRLGYIYCRVLKWNRRQLVRNFLLLPLSLIGLLGWAVGFRQGCRTALEKNL